MLFSSENKIYCNLKNIVPSVFTYLVLDVFLRMTQLLRITRKPSPIITQCNIHGHVLGVTDTAKYLGVTLHSTVHGRNTSARQPRRPTTFVPSSRGISVEHHHRLETGLRDSRYIGPFWSTLALSGTHTLNQTFRLQAGDGATPVC